MNKPYFERLLSFLDWAIYSDAGMTLTTWGVEGVTFEQTPAGKAFLPIPQTTGDTATEPDYTAEYGLDTLFNLNENEEFEDYKKPPEIVAFLEQSLAAQDAATMDPQLALDASAIEAIQILTDKLDPYVTDASRSFITGELDIDADWDAYLSALEKRGYTTLEEIWNSAWISQNQE